MADAAEEAQPPKLFVSYSWTSEDHKQWVLDLAAGLRESGVDVILDRWHLLDGQDSDVFMERMVNDPDIKHVALICDRRYVEKANTREGGAGTEAQIITRSIYENHQQTKFVALVTETDEDGRPVRPHYYGAKKYIPFLDPEAYADDFDKVLRWVFDKPLDKPPPVGKPPAFLSEDERAIKLATASLQRRAIDAIKNGKPNALANLTEYLDRVVDEFERLRIRYDGQDQSSWDEAMMHCITEFLPYRNELIAVFVTVAMYADGEDYRDVLHRFFEGLIRYQDRPEALTSWNPNESDNYGFVIHELFLYLIAAFLKCGKFEAITRFLTNRYYVGPTKQVQDRLMGFRVFFSHSKTLEARKGRLKLNIWNMESMLLKERSGGQPIPFDMVITADLILYMHDRFIGGSWFTWFPLTFVHLGYHQPTLELFARAQSLRYFDRIKGMLGTKDLATFKTQIAELDKDQHRPRANMHTLQLSHTVQADKLGTAP